MGVFCTWICCNPPVIGLGPTACGKKVPPVRVARFDLVQIVYWVGIDLCACDIRVSSTPVTPYAGAFPGFIVLQESTKDKSYGRGIIITFFSFIRIITIIPTFSLRITGASWDQFTVRIPLVAL
jgi:hypothetical protein